MTEAQRAFALADTHVRELMAAGASSCLVAVVLPSGCLFIANGRIPEVSTLLQLKHVAALVAEQDRDNFPGCLAP